MEKDREEKKYRKEEYGKGIMGEQKLDFGYTDDVGWENAMTIFPKYRHSNTEHMRLKLNH